MVTFRYTHAQEECDDAREVLIKKRIDLITENNRSVSQRCAEDIMLINDVLDYVKRQFYINWEDK